MCKHETTARVAGSERGFSGSVAVEPYTHERRAAHGNICLTERCSACGAERQVNVNQGFREYGPWGPDAAARQRREQEARRSARQGEEAAEDAAMQAAGIVVVRRRERQGCQTMVDVVIHGRHQSLPLWQVEEAAAQQDVGLRRVYRAILRHAERADAVQV